MTLLKLCKIKGKPQIVRNSIVSVLKNSNANFRKKIILSSNYVQELRATSQKQTITLKRGMNDLRKSNN
jgi:RNase P subunit RPR2